MTQIPTHAARKIRPHVLAVLPFMAGWIYMLAVYFPGHPNAPDPATGRTLALGVSNETVYLSGWEMALFMGIFACMLVIIGTGLFRVARAAGKI